MGKRNREEPRNYPVGAQLGVNLLWSLLFFGLHSPSAALACIVVLLALILATINTFYRLSKPAAVLVPYLAWVCIATALNARGRSPELKSLTRKEPLLPGTVRTSPINRHADLVARRGMNYGRFSEKRG